MPLLGPHIATFDDPPVFDDHKELVKLFQSKLIQRLRNTDFGCAFQVYDIRVGTGKYSMKKYQGTCEFSIDFPVTWGEIYDSLQKGPSGEGQVHLILEVHNEERTQKALDAEAEAIAAANASISDSAISDSESTEAPRPKYVVRKEIVKKQPPKQRRPRTTPSIKQEMSSSKKGKRRQLPPQERGNTADYDSEGERPVSPTKRIRLITTSQGSGSQRLSTPSVSCRCYAVTKVVTY